MRRIFVIIVTLLVAAVPSPACAQHAAAAPRRAELVTAAPESLTTSSGAVVRVRATLWLNLGGSPFTPASDGVAPLRGNVTLYAAPGMTLPADLRADSVWLVIDGEVVDHDTLTGQPQPPAPGQQQVEWVVSRTDSTISYRLWNGPARLLKAGSAVVVVRLVQGAGPVGLLRSPRSGLSTVR